MLRCRQWPGLQCIDALTEGKPLEEIWHDCSLEYEAKRRGKELDPETFTRYTLKLDPLPCWRYLPEEQIRRRIREIVDDVDAQAARRVVLNGVKLPSAESIRKQDPHKIPDYTKTSPAPAVHAASKAVRKQMKEAYRLFVEAYREAATDLRAGNPNAKFPPGCFPPPRRRRAGTFKPVPLPLDMIETEDFDCTVPTRVALKRHGPTLPASAYPGLTHGRRRLLIDGWRQSATSLPSAGVKGIVSGGGSKAWGR